MTLSCDFMRSAWDRAKCSVMFESVIRVSQHAVVTLDRYESEKIHFIQHKIAALHLCGKTQFQTVDWSFGLKTGTIKVDHLLTTCVITDCVSEIKMPSENVPFSRVYTSRVQKITYHSTTEQTVKLRTLCVKSFSLHCILNIYWQLLQAFSCLQ